VGLFHRCRRWKTISKCYTPGSGVTYEGPMKTHTTEDSRLLLNHMQQMQFGVTTIEQICEDCGRSHAYTITGKIEGATINTWHE